MIRPQFQNRQATATGQILLMTEVRVGDNEELKPSDFGRVEQRAVLDPYPTLLLNGDDLVSGKSVADLRGNAFVEQNLHAAA